MGTMHTIEDMSMEYDIQKDVIYAYGTIPRQYADHKEFDTE